MNLPEFFIRIIGREVTENKTCGYVFGEGYSVCFWKDKKEENTYRFTKIDEVTNEAENFKLTYKLEGV